MGEKVGDLPYHSTGRLREHRDIIVKVVSERKESERKTS